MHQTTNRSTLWWKYCCGYVIGHVSGVQEFMQ